MPIERLDLYRKGLKVERLHTMPHIIPYNNGFHSANAALIAHELCVLNGLNSASLVMYMLLHDVAEGYVGDVPANVKTDYPDIKHALNEAEKDWEERNIPHLPNLSHQERKIAKAADLLELGMHCLDELAIGNNDMQFVLKNVIQYSDQYREDIAGFSKLIDHLKERRVTNGR